MSDAKLKPESRERIVSAAAAIAQTYGDGYDVEVDEHEGTEVHRSGVTGFWVQGWVYVPRDVLREGS